MLCCIVSNNVLYFFGQHTDRFTNISYIDLLVFPDKDNKPQTSSPASALHPTDQKHFIKMSSTCLSFGASSDMESEGRAQLHTFQQNYLLLLFYLILFHHFYTAAFGSIPELPATNCREIKLSEGEQAFSGKYWYYNPWTETATFAYCDMKTEGNL